jgi:sugar lactone lactonase YvrE
MLQGRKSGMLLEYDPASGLTTCLQDELWFANGVAVPKDGSFVLYVETPRLRVLKLWLTGTQVQHLHVISELQRLISEALGISRHGTIRCAEQHMHAEVAHLR